MITRPHTYTYICTLLLHPVLINIMLHKMNHSYHIIIWFFILYQCLFGYLHKLRISKIEKCIPPGASLETNYCHCWKRWWCEDISHKPLLLLQVIAHLKILWRVLVSQSENSQYDQVFAQPRSFFWVCMFSPALQLLLLL
jgi:hypothetical protein